ncbi:MAG TPA: endonuclease MutS2 [candidate division Zixibacteria bacterium]|mgnify:CR=1 FL=1|nr:endonuclease MutS2 [candidate division Zixibacteria bacterium]
MDEHTLHKLEFDKIKVLLRDICHTPAGVARAENLYPRIDYEQIKRELAETAQLTEILRFEEPFVMQTLDPVDLYLSRLKVENSYLDATEYLKVAHFLRVCHSLTQYMKGKADKYPLINSYISEIKPAPEVLKKIEKAIDKTGEVMDSASPKLRKIRIEKQLVRNRILARLESMIQSRRTPETRQDDLITIRDGRYVIPMQTSDVTSKTGVIHGRSKTGMTLFVEPMATVEMNNHLRELLNEEEEEIERILIDIGDSVRSHLPEFRHNYEMVGIIDFIHAKARLAVRLDCNPPRLVERPYIDLKDSRHPLLLISVEKQSEVVPLDIHLAKDFDCIVITGPNMGGKTVALKTVGLLSLMVQSGLLIPAHEDSAMGIFGRIFADIGDEQSIELSLSTFSSHVSKIIAAVKNCDENTLILMDELGAGTDPVEGSALGEAILKKILDCKGKAIITTHYSALKTLPEKDRRIQNASLEFDQKTLKPTYRLQIGLPGSSYAIEMAKRLGMPQDIVEDAVQLMGTQERNLAELIERLQAETQDAEEAKKAALQEKEEVDRLRKHYLDRQDQIAEEQQAYKEKAMKEAEDLVKSTRTRLEQLVRNIKEHKADKESVKEAHKFIKEKQDEFRSRLEKMKTRKETAMEETLSPGDRVFIENLRTEGELIDYNENTDSWRVQTGSIIASVKSDLLKKIRKQEPRRRVPSGVNYAPFEDVPMQISVRGMTAEEAISAVEKYLDSVSIANLETVYILHGKGTGALRKAIGDYLKTHPMVENHRLGYFNEGGAGVTVIKMKKS